MKKFSLFLCLFCGMSAWAFLPPQDTREGVALRIEGFDDIHDVHTDLPLAIRVTAENTRGESVTGSFRVWMNDDWKIPGAAEDSLTLKPGEKRTFDWAAEAKPSVLEALYPIHATFAFGLNGTNILLHPIAIFRAKTPLAAESGSRPVPELREGVARLASLPFDAYMIWSGARRPPDNGATFVSDTFWAQDIAKRGFGSHPPWRGGWGLVGADFKLRLPEKQPIALSFFTALRQKRDVEPESDGAEQKVFVIAGGTTNEVFTRFSASHAWQPASADLSAYAGKEITLRFQTGPGPHNDTTCDFCFWGEPALAIGQPATPMPPPEARKYAFPLPVRGETFTATVTLGSQGVLDGGISFTDGKRTLAYHGFTCDVDNDPVTVSGFSAVMKNGELNVTHRLADALRAEDVSLRCRIRVDGAGLRVAWDMPSAKRVPHGEPRYTKLAIGPCDEAVSRAYMGFGNVIENPKSFRISGGAQLTTRHVGADYANGLSLLQACDIFPDCVTCAAAEKSFCLVTQNDASFLFIPSAKGAFGAARAYQDQTGFRRSGGWETIAGRMCLDQWSGLYATAAQDLKRAARYGLTDAVFVKHDWQCWGYDYRLPEIFPPNAGLGSYKDFLSMRNAARDAGILFAPHDNYIDFYPDAEGFSYDHIVFTAAGHPYTAWYNPGRDAQSYRWLPHAFGPWLRKNMGLFHGSFAPDALFIDVFTSIAPFDYYDRKGTYYTRDRTSREWGNAFNTARRILKAGAPMISETGNDFLIGDVDAGEADHPAATQWIGSDAFTDSERVPWHDMATHGKMILLAGGLGSRYSGSAWDYNGPKELHEYGSDDYLSNTMLGGRNPMCDGPCSRKAVMTYWLQHDLCAELARATFESHEFVDGIHRQHTTFSNGGEVWANRSTNVVWNLPDGQVLPSYGFYAETPDCEAGIISIAGQRAAYAKSPTAFFADARPLYNDERSALAISSTESGEYRGNGNFHIVFSWTVLKPCGAFKPFIHITELGKYDPILFQTDMVFDLNLLKQPGSFKAVTDFHVPETLPPSDYQVRYGMWNPVNGDRLLIGGGFADYGNRIKGGILHVRKDGASFEMEPVPVKALELNTEGRMLSFGAVSTDGAFRLVHGRRGFWQIFFGIRPDWELLPLPGSKAFNADIDLAAFGAAGATVAAVEPRDPLIENACPPKWSQSGDKLSFACDGASTSYCIRFR